MAGSNMDKLASLHPDANYPCEPYRGVAALFNADLANDGSGIREEWEVISPYELRYLGRTEAEEQELDEIGGIETSEVLGVTRDPIVMGKTLLDRVAAATERRRLIRASSKTVLPNDIGNNG